MSLEFEFPENRPGLCPACRKLFWIRQYLAEEMLNCPHCDAPLMWFHGEFVVWRTSREALDEAQDLAQSLGIEIENSLLKLEHVHPADIDPEQFGYIDDKRFDLKTIEIPDEVLAHVPGQIARDHLVLPLMLEDDGTLIVAMVDPMDLVALDKLQFICNREIRVTVKPREEINRAVRRIYGHSD